MVDAPGPNGARLDVASLGDRWERLTDWWRRLAAELVELPETLRALREGAANFEVVGRRLSESSEALEQMTELYESTLADSAKLSADAARALRSQLDALAAAGSPDRVMAAVGEMQRVIESMAELNPFSPARRGRAEPRD
jgi:hypothetical protein